MVAAIVFLILILIVILVKFWPEPLIDYDDNRSEGTAKVIIEDFSDFQCPFCGKAVETLDAIKEKYGDDVEINYRHFIVHGTSSRDAAMAVECARDQDMFDEYKHVLFANSEFLTVDRMKNLASDVGLDGEKFRACLDSGEKYIIIKYDNQVAKAKGIKYTPTMIINGDIVLIGARPQEEIEQHIDAILAE